MAVFVSMRFTLLAALVLVELFCSFGVIGAAPLRDSKGRFISMGAIGPAGMFKLRTPSCFALSQLFAESDALNVSICTAKSNFAQVRGASCLPN